MLKPIVILHRYLGVAIGLMMLIWCLSGFVMMYQGFPNTDQSERLKARETLSLNDCCDLSLLGGSDSETLGSFEIRMRNAEPVISYSGGTYSLRSGFPVDPLNEEEIRKIAIDYASAHGIDGKVVSLEPAKVDQWNMFQSRSYAPLWKAQFDDKQAYALYVSASEGEVVQDTHATERFLNWLGAVPHWLYPQILKQNNAVWTQIIYWTATVGIFLTFTGLIVGIARLRSRSGKYFPYKRKLWLWHHVTGFFAGLILLTWVTSGLLTMRPWGLLKSEPTVSRTAVTGDMTWGEAKRLIRSAQAEAGEFVSIRSQVFAGQPFLLAYNQSGYARRLESEGVLTVSRVQTLFEDRGLDVANVSLLTKDDSYYFGHKREVELPIIRAILDDGDKTHIYVDPETWQIRRVVTATEKRFRWFESGFHSFDWPVIRERPFWDIIVILLLIAVTAVAATGTWLSFTRVGRDVGRLFRQR